MRTVPVVLLLGCAPLFFSGCSFVYCEKPFGAPLDKSELKQFEGEWQGGQVMALKLVKDHLVGGMLQFDDKREEFAVETVHLHFTRLNDAMFLFAREKATEPYMMLYVHSATPTKLNLRLGDVKKFNALLDQGHVKGKRISEMKDSQNPPSVLLDLSDETFTALLKHASLDELFPKESSCIIEKCVPTQ